jgi:hypothetical protein
MSATRVLVLTPWVPYPPTGACQQDRFFGLKQMQSLGYELQVIARIHAFQDRPAIEAAFAQEEIPLTLVPHSANAWPLLFKNLHHALTNPGYFDGAALEYADADYLRIVREAVESFKPNVAWLEYTVLWPALRLVQSMGIPAIVKSSLNEPRNCRDENGDTWISRIKSLPKYPGEKIAAREADMILAITPDEERWYRSLGAKKTGVLPLRGLAHCLERRTHAEKPVLDAVFLSSNFNMGHNRDALVFLLEQVVPRIRERAPGTFRFHITGKKFPKRYEHFLADDVRTVGFVPDIGAFLRTMDLAVCPWISGQGMQQKVFEPLCRELPLITDKVAGYPFVDGKEVLLAHGGEAYVERLLELTSTARRQEVADSAYAKAQSLFAEDVLKKTVSEAIAMVAR